MTTSKLTPGEAGAIWLVCMFIAIGNMFLGAFVSTVLWGWFIVPFGLPAIGMAWAFGLMMVRSVFTFKGDWSAQKNREADVAFNDTLARTLAYLVIWGIGYLAHIAM